MSTEATKISTKATKTAPIAALAPVMPKATEAQKAAPVAAKLKGAPVAAPIAAKLKAEAPKTAPVAASSPIIAQPGSLDLVALKKEAEGMKATIAKLEKQLVDEQAKTAKKLHPADRVQSATEIMGRTRMAVPADDWRQALHGCSLMMLSFDFAPKTGDFSLDGKKLIYPGLFTIPALDDLVPPGVTQADNIAELNAGNGHLMARPMGDNQFIGIPCSLEHVYALLVFNVEGYCVDSYVGEDERKLNEETGEYEGEDNRPLMRFVLPVGRYDAAGNYTASNRDNFDDWICLGPTPIAS